VGPIHQKSGTKFALKKERECKFVTLGTVYTPCVEWLWCGVGSSHHQKNKNKAGEFINKMLSIIHHLHPYIHIQSILIIIKWEELKLQKILSINTNQWVHRVYYSNSLNNTTPHSHRHRRNDSKHITWN